MYYSEYRFTLDLHKHQSQQSIAVFKGDTAVRLYISITDGGKSYFIGDGWTAYFFGSRADEEPLIHPCMIRGNTEIVYDFKESTAFIEGIVDCQIRLYGKDKQLISAPKFIIVVDERVAGDAINYIDDDKLDALDAIQFAEIDRVEAETARVEAEKARAEAEIARAEAETARVEAEIAREKAVTDALNTVETEILPEAKKANETLKEAINATKIMFTDDNNGNVTITAALGLGLTCIDDGSGNINIMLGGT